MYQFCGNGAIDAAADSANLLADKFFLNSQSMNIYNENSGDRNSYHRSIRLSGTRKYSDNLLPQASICDFRMELDGLELCAVAANHSSWCCLCGADQDQVGLLTVGRHGTSRPRPNV